MMRTIQVKYKFRNNSLGIQALIQQAFNNENGEADNSYDEEEDEDYEDADIGEDNDASKYRIILIFFRFVESH